LFQDIRLSPKSAANLRLLFVISKKIGRNFYFINTRIFGKISVFFKEKLYMCRKLSGCPDINVEVQKKVPDASRTEDFKSSILIYEVQSVLEHGCL